MDFIKNLINTISDPKILFNLIVLGFLIVFAPIKFFEKINKSLGVDRLWTKQGGIGLFSMMLVLFGFGLTDPNFRLIVAKPDNVPIVALLFLVVFFLWLAMSQAKENDLRIAKGEKPNEFADSKEKVLVWPDLVYIEFICLVCAAAVLLIWAMMLHAPLEEPANPSVSPNPAKAPWYFLGLQEMLVYFDPWLAGVVIPSIMLLGLMAIPYIDNNRKGAGYYTFNDRKMAISIFLFCWLCLWIFLISTGTFLRGPNWNFFGPFEYWDPHKLAVLNNVNLSEIIYMKILGVGLPKNIFAREFAGFIVLGTYLGLLPLVLAKTIFKSVYERLGALRYSIFIILLLLALSLPIKMGLRWAFNIKYIIAIPEYFFNI